MQDIGLEGEISPDHKKFVRLIHMKECKLCCAVLIEVKNNKKTDVSVD